MSQTTMNDIDRPAMRKAAPAGQVGRRLRALASASFRLDALGPRAVALDLSLRHPLGEAQAAKGADLFHDLGAFLSEAGLPLADGEAARRSCSIDARNFLSASASGRRGERLGDSAGEALGLALFLVAGVRGWPRGRLLDLGLPAAGLPLRTCRLLEDRLSWLAANAVLVGPAGPGSGTWLRRLADAFRVDFGEAS